MLYWRVGYHIDFTVIHSLAWHKRCSPFPWFIFSCDPLPHNLNGRSPNINKSRPTKKLGFVGNASRADPAVGICLLVLASRADPAVGIGLLVLASRADSPVDIKRKPSGWQVCEERFLELLPRPYHPRPEVEGDAAGVITRGVCPHAPVNHMVFFLCHGFIKFMYINKILMKTRL